MVVEKVAKQMAKVKVAREAKELPDLVVDVVAWIFAANAQHT